MKTRFNTYDIICMVSELQRLIGMRVNQVYDIDNKSYVIRLQRSEEKSILLLESGNKFHTTNFEWPKNVAPSGFTMKLRKHLKNKRLERLGQIGVDRIVDMQFGSGEAAYHVILELYDRGNIILTDCDLNILNVLRPHVEGDKFRFAVKEKYPLERAKTSFDAPNDIVLKEIINKSKPGDNLKKMLNPNLEYGASIIDHVLLENGLSGNMKVSQDPNKGFFVERDLDKLVTALKQAELLMKEASSKVAKGYIIQKKEDRPNPQGGESYMLANQEFHPLLYSQNKQKPYAEYETFDRAVDEFFSALEGQKIDLKTIQIEREAVKKLQNVRKDHEKRLNELETDQIDDRQAAEMISWNEELVEQARLAVTTAIANQMSWDDIHLLVKTAQDNNDPIASAIKQLKLATNHITLMLRDPYEEDEETEPMMVDIDLSLTAHANARRYYDQKRNAATKQQKTLESADIAMKNAERNAKKTMKEAQTISNITKARKTYWFEKFYWFISSDNFLVIAGRDQQQNELVVKRYMRSADAYVHAELSGAASVVVKCGGRTPPPRTLSEAGVAAAAYSVAWDAKVVTRAWWVWGAQVSKSAPTGEYLSTGSFMIRGKKNYLLPDHLQFGFSFMFRLEDSCIEKHRGERKCITADDGSEAPAARDAADPADSDDEEIVVSDDDEPSDNSPDLLPVITEEITALEMRNGNNTEAEIKDKEEEIREAYIENEEKIREADIENEEEKMKEEESGSESEDSSEDVLNTHIKIDHGTGQVTTESRTRTSSDVYADETTFKFPSLPKKGKKPQKDKQIKKEEKPKEGLKRGQKGKMKKIKDKYRHQDDEDRAMMMEFLKPAKSVKDTKKAQKQAAKVKSKSGGKAQKIPQPAPVLLEADSDADVEPDAETESAAPDVDTEMLCQLTGAPLATDELLYAVPVVAPYTALHNYKYKVKLTPGSSKRGKAAKTALAVFLRDRTATPREKDLLKAVKEENYARNFPGKVKLSAPQLHKHKK